MNKDILRVIKTKNVQCNLLVTCSGLNSTGTLHQYFDTVCDVQGFQENDGQRFAQKLGQREQELVLKVLSPEADSLIALLVVLWSTLESSAAEFREATTLTNLRSPYDIYVGVFKWRTLSFEAPTKLNFAKRVGKLALDILRFGKVLIDADIPDDSCGFFVKSKASLVSFVHSSFQIFFAAPLFHVDA